MFCLFRTLSRHALASMRLAMPKGAAIAALFRNGGAKATAKAGHKSDTGNKPPFMYHNIKARIRTHPAETSEKRLPTPTLVGA